MEIRKVQGYIIELLRSYKTKTKTLEVWEICWKKKIYDSIEIAEDAYKQRPKCYKEHDLKARIITMYRGDYKIIEKEELTN